MEKPYCTLISDDLTGACDAAVHFAARGFAASVLVAADARAAGADVVVASTGSRNCSEAEQLQRIRRTAKRLPAGHILFKKIDSTMRGNPGWEIACAMEAFGCDKAIVTPALPAQGRIVEGGWLRVQGDPQFPPVDIASRLIQQGLCADRFVLHNAASDADLDRIVARARQERVLWAGSGGLAAALARTLPVRKRPMVTFPASPALFCLGSSHRATLAQQERLIAERAAVMTTSPGRIAEALTQNRHVVLRIPRCGGEVLEWIRTARPAPLVLSGGDTAAIVAEALGVQRIDLVNEIEPGIPCGVLRGGLFDTLPVATKSGGFGGAGVLVHVADFFLWPQHSLSY